jgi:hypothetical protein
MPAHALRVAVQVDEPRRDDATRGMEDDVAAQVGADGGNDSTLEGEVSRGVEALTGVDQAPAADHHGVLAGRPSTALGQCYELASFGHEILPSGRERVKSDGCPEILSPLPSISETHDSILSCLGSFCSTQGSGHTNIRYRRCPRRHDSLANSATLRYNQP